MAVTKAQSTVVRKNSAGSEFQRRKINLIEGDNITLTVSDDAANNEVDITIAAGGNYSYLHTQASGSATWSIEHNLNDSSPVVAVVVAGEIVEPQGIEIVDADNITITFGSSVTGTAKIISSGVPETIASGYVPKLYVYLPDYKTQTEIDTFITNEIGTNGKFWGVMWENFRFNSDGSILFVDDTEAGSGNLGFDAGNKTRVQSIADNVLVTVAGDVSGATGAGAMLADSGLRAAAVTAIVSHIGDEGLQGVNINFEPIADLTGTMLTNFRTFIAALKVAMDAVSTDLILTWAGQISWDSDQPNKEYSSVNYTGESNMAGTNLLSFTLNDLEDMGFDIIEMQAYDQFYDLGAQEFGITSMDQVSNAIDFAHSRLSKAKYGLIIGTYGVRMDDGAEVYGAGLNLNNATRAEITAADATFYSSATRALNRYLIKSVTGSKQILAPDQKTIDTYYAICKNKQVQYIGFWLAGDYYYPSER